MIPNKQKKLHENENYWFVGHLSDDGFFTPLLLTAREMEIAKKRAERNPEDVPHHSIVFQQISGGNPVGQKYNC